MNENEVGIEDEAGSKVKPEDDIRSNVKTADEIGNEVNSESKLVSVNFDSRVGVGKVDFGNDDGNIGAVSIGKLSVFDNVKSSVSGEGVGEGNRADNESTSDFEKYVKVVDGEKLLKRQNKAFDELVVPRRKDFTSTVVFIVSLFRFASYVHILSSLSVYEYVNLEGFINSVLSSYDRLQCGERFLLALQKISSSSVFTPILKLNMLDFIRQWDNRIVRNVVRDLALSLDVNALEENLDILEKAEDKIMRLQVVLDKYDEATVRIFENRIVNNLLKMDTTGQLRTASLKFLIPLDSLKNFMTLFSRVREVQDPEIVLRPAMVNALGSAVDLGGLGVPRSGSFGRYCGYCKKTNHTLETCRLLTCKVCNRNGRHVACERGLRAPVAPGSRGQINAVRFHPLMDGAVLAVGRKIGVAKRPLGVQALINGQSARLMVDTGASTSLIKRESALGFGIPVLPLTEQQFIAGPGGEPLDIVGQTAFAAQVGAATVHVDSLVGDNLSFDGDGLIGFPDLVLNNLNLSCAAGETVVSFGPRSQHAYDLRAQSSAESQQLFADFSLEVWEAKFRETCSQDFTHASGGKLVADLWKAILDISNANEFWFLGGMKGRSRTMPPVNSSPPVEIRLKPGADLSGCKPYRAVLRPEVETVLNEYADMLLRENRAYHSDSHVGCNANAVPKGKDEHRVVADHRKLSQQTSQSAAITPTVRSTLESMLKLTFGMKFVVFASLDLQGYFSQFLIHEDSQYLMAQQMGESFIAMRVADFGMQQMPKQCHFYLENLLKELEIAGVRVYIDDIGIIAGGDTLDEAFASLFSTLVRVFGVLAENRMTISLPKMVVGVQEMEFLGFQISAAGISPTQDRILDLSKMPLPKTTKEMQGFLASFILVRPFDMTNAAEMEAILRDGVHGLGQSEVITYTVEMREAAEAIKSSLVHGFLTLSPIDPAEPLHIWTDASTMHDTVGYVLLQWRNDNWVVVAANSVRLAQDRRRRNAKKREAAEEERIVGVPEGAVVSSGASEAELAGLETVMDKERAAMLSASTKIWHTDSRTAGYAAGDPGYKRDATTLRILLKAQEFGPIAIAVEEAKQMAVPDFLSRLPGLDFIKDGAWAKGGRRPRDWRVQGREMEEVNFLLAEGGSGPQMDHLDEDAAPQTPLAMDVEGVEEHKEEVNVVQEELTEILDDGLTFDQRRQMFRQGWVESLRDDLVSSRLMDLAVNPDPMDELMFLEPSLSSSGLLMVLSPETGKRVCWVPDMLRRLPLQSAHDDVDAGHASAEYGKLYLSKHFYWFSMLKDLRDYCASCITCQRARVHQGRKGINPKPAPKAGERWQVDTAIFGDAASGEIHRVITLVCEGSGKIIGDVAKDGTAEAAAEVFRRLADGQDLHSVYCDGGGEFHGVFKRQCEELGVEFVQKSPNDPSPMGKVNRSHRSLKEIMGKYMASENHDADQIIKDVLPGQQRDLPASRRRYDIPKLLDRALAVINDKVDRTRGATPNEIYDGSKPEPRCLDSILGICEEDIRTQEERETERVQAEEKGQKKAKEAREKMKENYNERRRAKQIKFRVGDKVMMRSETAPTKVLQAGIRWTGPFLVSLVFDGGQSLELSVDGQVMHAKIAARDCTPFIEPVYNIPPVPQNLARLVRIQRLALAEMPEGKARFSLYNKKTRAKLEARQAAQEAAAVARVEPVG